MKALALLFTLLFCSFLRADEYAMIVYEAVPRRGAKEQILFGSKCLHLLEQFPATAASKYRRTGIASYSQDPDGSYNYSVRGQMMTEVKLADMQQEIDAWLSRVIFDYRQSGFYTEEQLRRIYNLHQRLSTDRTKLISIQGFDRHQFISGPASANVNYFSALRIFDSSPRMKNWGVHWSPDNATEFAKDPAEMAFAPLNLTQLFRQLGIPAERYRWSLGIGDVSGKHENAMSTLFAQIADLLDQHYNRRDYFHFKSTAVIESEDVDITFYSNEKLKDYYTQIFGIGPLTKPNGSPLTFGNGGKNFYLFHIKGSQFLRRFLDNQLHEPSYAPGRDHSSKRDYVMGKVAPIFESLRAEDFISRSSLDLVRHLHGLNQTAQGIFREGRPPSEREIYLILAKAIHIKRGLRDGVYEPMTPEQKRQAERLIHETDLSFIPLKGLPPETRTEDLWLVSQVSRFLMSAELTLGDPVLTFINKMTWNNKSAE